MNLELATVVQLENRTHEKADGMLLEVAGHITQSQTSLRPSGVHESSTRWSRGAGDRRTDSDVCIENLARLQVAVEIHREAIAAQGISKDEWSEFVGSQNPFFGFFEPTHLQQEMAKVERGAGEVRA